jgi:hypothetical protein
LSSAAILTAGAAALGRPVNHVWWT